MQGAIEESESFPNHPGSTKTASVPRRSGETGEMRTSGCAEVGLLHFRVRRSSFLEGDIHFRVRRSSFLEGDIHFRVRRSSLLEGDIHFQVHRSSLLEGDLHFRVRRSSLLEGDIHLNSECAVQVCLREISISECAVQVSLRVGLFPSAPFNSSRNNG